ncbi:hypothetical protein DL768_005518 [Monosporascus sp. mg162]|nr:hypothetical protein DL768_005518 [Monosporascus sp. mg162]
MACSPDDGFLGLHQIAPPSGATDNNTSLEFVYSARTSETLHLTSTVLSPSHGLDAASPKTWECRHKDGRSVNWRSDRDMLPAAVPYARIYTYDWEANCSDHAPVQTLFGHAGALLARAAEARASSTRPIIFVASCFGGLVLAEAGGHTERIMGDQASGRLIEDLEREQDYVWQRVHRFAEVANAESVRWPVACFYEIRMTELLSKLLPQNMVNTFANGRSKRMNAYREFGQRLGVKGIEDDKADVKTLVESALSNERRR